MPLFPFQLLLKCLYIGPCDHMLMTGIQIYPDSWPQVCMHAGYMFHIDNCCFVDPYEIIIQLFFHLIKPEHRLVTACAVYKKVRLSLEAIKQTSSRRSRYSLSLCKPISFWCIAASKRKAACFPPTSQTGCGHPAVVNPYPQWFSYRISCFIIFAHE